MNRPAHNTTTTGAAYWEPVWQEGRRYRTISEAESEALRRHLGPGRDRPALDIGCGNGALTARLAQLGYRTTGIDCAPTAVATAQANHPHLTFMLRNFDTNSPARLPHPAFSVIACRLVYRWIPDKSGFRDRVRSLPRARRHILGSHLRARPRPRPAQGVGPHHQGGRTAHHVVATRPRDRARPLLPLLRPAVVTRPPSGRTCR